MAVGSTTLMAASHSGHLDVVNVLIKTNADVHLKDDDDKMALDDARKRGYTTIVEALQKAGAKLKTPHFLSIKCLIFPSTALIFTPY